MKHLHTHTNTHAYADKNERPPQKEEGTGFLEVNQENQKEAWE